MALTIIEDTRQQAGKHEAKREWWEREGVAVVRSKLAFGDYALPPAASVDTKMSIAELAMDIDQQHERFRAECAGARDAGCALVILVENDDGVRDLASLAAWRESDRQFALRKRAVRRIDGSRLAKACMTMHRKYGVRFEFCAPGEAARRVIEILTEEGRRGRIDA